MDNGVKRTQWGGGAARYESGVPLMGLRYTSAAERRAEIRRRVETDHFVTVLDLVDVFGVSPNTVRRDLQKLADDDQLRVVHGGAAAFTGNEGLPFPTRAVRAQSEKRRIAELAVQYVEPDSTIALDSGTTVLELAKLLPADHGLTVVSNSLPALSALSRRVDINLIGVGGQYSADTQSFGGPDAWHALEHLGVHTLFLAASAISSTGVFAVTPYEAATKRLLIEASERVIVVSDSSKLTASAPIRVCGWDRVTRLVTDRQLPELAERLPGLVVNVAAPEGEDITEIRASTQE